MDRIEKIRWELARFQRREIAENEGRGEGEGNRYNDRAPVISRLLCRLLYTPEENA